MTENTKAPFSIARLDHLVLRTEDPARLIAFYEALGCETERVVVAVGLHQLRAGASVIDIVDVHGEIGRMGGGAPDPQARNLDHFALRIDPFDLDALKVFFDAIGAEIAAVHSRLFGADGYGPAVYVKDPDGNIVELKGPPIQDSQ